MKPSVYIADLRHNFAGALGSDCMPLGVAYIKAVMDRDLPAVQSRLFAYPESLLQAIRENPPDVLLCSNYLWNEMLSLHFMRLVKQIRPQTLTVMGGPNIHVEADRQMAWFGRQPWLDAYILGEGDFLATDIVREFLDSGMDLGRFGARELPSTIYRRPDGSVVRQAMWNRRRELDDIPSPFLTGIQDDFFDGKLAPMIETNRGCPFQCTFCVQGTDWYTKVNYFDLDRLKEELEYIARKIQERSPRMTMLRIADSNYGMFERDVEISGKIGEIQKHYGWPGFIDVTTGKNRPDRVIRSVEKAGGAPVLYMAVQSLDDHVLRNIKRQNIKLEAYDHLQVYMRGRGLRSNSDLILCLPGETLQSHVTALDKLLDQRIDQMHNLQLLLIKGSEIEAVASRQQFHFVSKFRLGPKDYGVYGDEKVFDIEEIVVSTDTMSFDEYLTARKLHLMCSVFWNDSWFEDAFCVTDQLGIPRSQVFHRLLPALEASRGPAREFLDSFVRETAGELFPSAEALLDHYARAENFDRLQQGDVGENLMYKYRALASFHIWPHICNAARDAFSPLVQQYADSIPQWEEFWSDLWRFIQEKHAHGATLEEVLAPAECELRYDFGAWMEAGRPLDVRPFRLPQPVRFRFQLTSTGDQSLRAAFAVWSSRIQGLAKLVTRIQIPWQVRQCAPVAESALILQRGAI